MRGAKVVSHQFKAGKFSTNLCRYPKLRLAVSLGVLALTGSANGSTLYWDGDGTGAVGNPPTSGVGGSGTWSNSITPNWFNGTAYQLWSGPGGQDIADFRGTAGTVTINSGETENANQLIFNTDGYTIAGDPTTTLNLTGPSIITTNVGTANITAPVSGNGLNVYGSGILNLTGTTSIGGAVTINAGATLLTNAIIGTSTTLSGGTLAYNVPSGSTVSGGSTPLTVTAASTIQFNQPGSGGASSYFYGALNLDGNLSFDAQTNAVNFYYGMPTINLFGGINLQGNETLSIAGINAGAPTQITTVSIPYGSLTGAYTLTKAGNGILDVPTGSNYSGLVITGGSVNASDPSGIPTSTLSLAGGTLGVIAPSGNTVTSAVKTTVSGISGINIDQPGNTGGASYNFGTLNLSGGTFSVAEPNPQNYYYNQATVAFGATTLAGDETVFVNGGTAGYTPAGLDRLALTLGPITGAHTLTKTGNGTFAISPGSNYSGLILTSGITTISDAGGIPTSTLGLAGGTLNLYAAAGVTVNDLNTTVTVSANTAINIDQPQNAGAATYNLGPLNLGPYSVTVTQPTTGHFYYGEPALNFGAVTLTGNAALSETGGTAGGILSTTLGPITGAYTLTTSGNASFNISAGTTGNYSGLVIGGGPVTINDTGGFPTANLGLAGSPLTLLLPSGQNAAVAATTVTADTVISIDQPGSTGAANYSFGTLSIGSNMLSLALTAPGDYYYGLPNISFGATTLSGNVNFNTSGAAGGFTLNPTIGAISGTGCSLTKSGSANLTLSGSDSYTGGTNVSAGQLIFAAPGALPMYSSLTIAANASAGAANHGTNAKNTLFASSLSIAGSTNAWTGLLDLSNNDLDVQNGSLATLTNQVKQGFNNGNWNGTGGIVSTAAAANTSHLTALGVIQNSVNGTTSGAALYGSGTALGRFDGASPAATDVLVKYTYYGDTNLDGKVDASDYSRVDNGYASHLTGWYNGDFNYDGVVNGSDYTLLDNAFNTQGAQIAELVSNENAAATAEIAGPSGTGSVPEPSALSLLGLGAVGLIGRRRRVK